MKKILFVMHTLGFGGAERSLVNLLHELPEGKYAADLLLFQKKGALLQQLPDWVHVLDTPDRLNRLYGPVRKAGALGATKLFGTLTAKLLRRTSKAQKAYRWKHFYAKHIDMLQTRYDVAVAYGGAELLYLIRDKVNADKKLAWIHNDYRTGQYDRESDRPYLADMDAIVSISDQCVDVLREEFPELAKKMHCIANITSAALIEKRASAGYPGEYEKDNRNILSVGRLWPQKGFDMAVEAAAILKKNGVKFHWFIIGEGQLRQKLEQQIQSLDVADCFTLLGTRENPYPYIRHCDLLVQSSRYEGKSVVLDEAKILAVPILATAYPTVHDQIEDGKEGVVTEMTARGIAQGIRDLLTEPAKLTELRDYLNSRSYGNPEETEKYMKLLDE